MHGQNGVWHDRHELVCLARYIVGFDLPATLDVNQHQATTHAFDELDVGNYRVCLSEAQNLDDFPLLYLVHPNLAHTILHVLHVD